MVSEAQRMREKRSTAAKIPKPAQVNGKLRGKLDVAVDAPKEQLEADALAQENVQRFLEGVTVSID